MRVVIDARPALDRRRTGVGYYAQQIIRHLPPADPDGRYAAWYLHARGLLKPRTFFRDVAPNLTEVASRFPARVFQPLSWRLRMPRVEWLAGAFDVLLATNFLPPPTTSRGVVLVVHDLAFRLFPETAPHHDARWRRRFDTWLADAALVIVPSDSAKRDLCEHYAIGAERVEAIHHGVDAHEFRPAPRAEIERVRRAFGIEEAPYALFVGGVEPRKNLEMLALAFARVPAPARLVIAGGPVRWDPEASDRLDAAVAALPPDTRGRVIRTGYVSEPDKAALLTGATVLAYPSRYEGFGFPVLEGFAAGLPVVTSNVSSLPEVAGDAAALVDPDDVDAIGAELTRLFDDEDLRNVLRAAGHARVAGFTWEATARATAAALRRAAGTGPG
ncbi:MAG TPA: glycosyltransferase family 1 protein [Actinomycetota bacterium]|jgi:glycosyltransferase involved in cell wall biosynthesis|nr:glycosyltransferase family 1 protein [Actinomycetota bacterium]